MRRGVASSEAGGAAIARTLCVAAAALFALISYLRFGNGIAGSGGALLSVLLAFLALLCSLLLATRPGAPRLVRMMFRSILFCCLCGTVVAAYFLETLPVLVCALAALACALAGLLGRPSRSIGRERRA